jgi:hypothetical protein
MSAVAVNVPATPEVPVPDRLIVLFPVMALLKAFVPVQVLFVPRR